ncbi:HAD domain-containing protein [Escherichia coli]|uniref:HAD domain-containing protein n=2 Tax=Escherichia coli TaxID=562 RepID=UPI0039657EC2
MQKSPLHEEVCVPEETTAGLWGPLPDSHVVLFLDFDGVCHRCKNETFERMPLVEKLLDKCPSMVIVISSSWRECASITYLKSLFRLPYRDKVIGATDSVYLKPNQSGVRAAECEDFVLMNPLMILVKIIKLRWIHILSYDQMVSRKINNQTTRCANSIFYTTLFTNSAPNYT